MGIWDEHLKEQKIEIKMNHCNRLQQPGLDAETVLHWGLPTAKLVLARRTPCDPWMFWMRLWIFQCGPGSDAKDLGKATGLVDSGMGLFEYLPQAEEWFDPVQHLVWLFWHLNMWKYWDIPKVLHGNFLSWNCNHLLKLLRKIYHKGCTTKVPYLCHWETAGFQKSYGGNDLINAVFLRPECWHSRLKGVVLVAS